MTLDNLEAEPPVHILANVEDVAPVETLADTLEMAEAKALCVTQSDVMVQKLVNTLANAR